MYLLLNNKIIGEEPSPSKIQIVFNLLKNYKDIVSLHRDEKNYIEAKKSILGGYELKQAIDNDLYVSELDCIKGEIVINTLKDYNSNSDSMLKKLKWKRINDYTFSKTVKNIALILLIGFLVYAKLNKELIEDFFSFVAGKGADPMLIVILIVLLTIIAFRKYLEYYKIIEGPKKFFATIPPVILLLLIIAWIISL
ncbi:MAG TPA: hypothetical protein VMT35_12285 [Ignavibacteriaceae bacterium]|nr:hypothetical protein [Ignavibacteriaceae bacterium]